MNEKIMISMMKDEATYEKMAKCKDMKELLAFLNAGGAECTMEDAEALLTAMRNSKADNGSMSQADMEAIAGGGLGNLWNSLASLFSVNKTMNVEDINRFGDKRTVGNPDLDALR